MASRWLGVGVAAMLTAAVGLQAARDRAGVAPARGTTPLWLHAGPQARHLALGYGNLAADIYWMRTVVYFGSQRLATAGAIKTYELLYPMLDLVTALDPDFKAAYRFGAIFLTEAYPDGPGRPDQALALLQRGIERQPDSWEYMHDTAFVHYWWMNDNASAAAWFTRAAAVPGAPAWLQPLAATTLAEGGDRELSRQMWRQMRDTSELAWIRQSAELRLVQLDALDGIDGLTQIVARFKARTGREPKTWDRLVAARLLAGVPLDPSGTAFVLDPDTGAVTVASDSPLFPLPSRPWREAK